MRDLPGRRPFAPVHEVLPTRFDTTDVDVTAAMAGDLDGDGDLDAVLGLCWLGDWGNAPLRNSLLRNLGGGMFREAFELLPDAPDIPRDIGSADIDGDGDLDLLLTNSNYSSFDPGPDHLYRNQAGERFVDASGQLVPGSDRGLVRFGDIDGDGDADLLHPRASTGLPELHANQGTGTFVDASASLPSGSNFWDGRLGDVDADGDLDVLLSAPTKSALWLNDGSGALTDASAGHVPLTLGAPEFELGDLDGDSDLDFGSFARLLLNDGSGTFTNRAVPNGVRPKLALRDVDGDGDLDLFGPKRLLENDGVAVFTEASAQLPAQANDFAAFAAGDFDDDGDVDALAAEDGSWLGPLTQRAEFLLLNDSQGTFTDSRTLPDAFTRGAVGPSALGPLDGDPFADLVLAAWTGGTEALQLFPGDGTGRFGSPVTLPAPGDWLHELRIARLDLDEANDLVVAGEPGVKVLFGPALGLVGTPILSETYGIEPGDFDGNGLVDLVTLEASPERNRLLLQAVPRGFTLATVASFPKLPGVPSAAAALDAESDGDLDVAFAQATVKLYSNQGPASFVDVSATHVPGGAATAVIAGDVSGDGAPDLLVGSSTDQRLLLNRGDGTFLARPDLFPSQPAAWIGHVLVDMDLDGDLDAVHGSLGVVFENGGRGSFQRRASVGFLWKPGLGDMDGDGDDDLLSSTQGDYEYASPTVLRNRARQLTWLSLPSIGEPLVFEITGPALEPYTLYSAIDRGQTATPFGTLWLDPASIVIVSQGRLGPAGTKRSTFPIPATLALIGTTRYWQALVGSPERYTNLEATTFTDL